jgi:hypothetical protein
MLPYLILIFYNEVASLLHVVCDVDFFHDSERLPKSCLNFCKRIFIEAVSDDELSELHTAGVRGLRCNIVDIADKSAGLPIEQLRNLAKRIQPLGWHLELLMHVNEYPDLAQTFDDFPVDLVFGHFGYAHTKHGVADQGFQGLLDLMKSERAWVKMTGPYRICDGDGVVCRVCFCVCAAAADRACCGWRHVGRGAAAARAGVCRRCRARR